MVHAEITGPCVRRRALALLACAAHAADSTPTGNLLIPRDEKDYANMLSALMESQHTVLQKTHGVDSPQVALSSQLLTLQTSVRAVPLMPQSWQHTASDAAL